MESTYALLKGMGFPHAAASRELPVLPTPRMLRAWRVFAASGNFLDDTGAEFTAVRKFSSRPKADGP